MANPPHTGIFINPNFHQSGDFGQTDLLHDTVSARLTKRAKLDDKDPLARGQASIHGAVSDLLGHVNVTPVMSRNLDLQQGYPHSTTGIPYAIQGTATQISVDVAEYLAGFNDPIKVILGTSIHKQAKIIITRKYVVGGKYNNTHAMRGFYLPLCARPFLPSCLLTSWPSVTDMSGGRRPAHRACPHHPGACARQDGCHPGGRTGSHP
jgi:hypothetical protein